MTPTPPNALQAGRWFKLICGASYQDLPAIRNLALAYALAGADCVDVAADPAAIAAARSGLQVAAELSEAARARGFFPAERPLLMASLSDGEDPHFRKATFDPETCPPACPRPCLQICPAGAISLAGIHKPNCYGCSRCLPVCPHQNITAHTYRLAPAAAVELLLSPESGASIDAIEIHTRPGREVEFARLWAVIAPLFSSAAGRLRLLAVSCPDGTDLIDYLRGLHDTIRASWRGPLVWQTDGRPMSGDIGAGTTHASVRLARKVLASGLPGYIQPAGGTNQHTASKLRSLGLLATHTRGSASRCVAGVAYGSYARVQLAPVLARLATANTGNGDAGRMASAAEEALEAVPELLWQAVATAAALTEQVKVFQTLCTALHDSK